MNPAAEIGVPKPSTKRKQALLPSERLILLATELSHHPRRIIEDIVNMALILQDFDAVDHQEDV